MGRIETGSGQELIGRRGDVALVERHLQRAGIVTIVGLGGVGKTSLARAIAARRSGADRPSVVVDLAPLGSPDAVGEVIAAAVGASEDAERTIAEAIAAAIDGTSTLLVLDNVEHLLRAAPLIGELAAALPSLRILATSRVQLGLPAETVVPLAPLELPTSSRDLEGAPASALFLRRARQRGLLTTLGADDAAALVDVCRRLDGLPLALELAAAWSGVLTPRAIERRLAAGRLGLAGDDDRQASLEAIVTSTLAFVDDGTADAFDALGVFAGGFDEAAAIAVTGRGDVIEALRRLQAIALVRVTPDRHGEPRFELLETVRAVALGRCSAERRNTAMRRHAACYVERAVAAADAMRSRSFAAGAHGDILADPNVLAVVQRAAELDDPVAPLRVAAALATRAMQTGILREALARLESALAAAGSPVEVPAAVRSDALNALVSLRGALGRHDGLENDARAALAAAREAGDDARIVRTLITLGNWTADDATPCYAEAAELADRMGYSWGAAVAWGSLADAHWYAGRTDDALAAMVHAQDASERDGDGAGAASHLAWLGEYELNLGRTAAAVSHLEEAVAGLRSSPGLPIFTTAALAILAAAYALAGRGQDAEARLAEAADRVGATEHDEEIVSWIEAAVVVLVASHPVVAARCLGALDGIREATGRSRVSDRLVAEAAGRIERAVGRPRLVRERDAGRRAGGAAVFEEAARLVRRSAPRPVGRVEGPFGDLTSRETEILGRLAAGKTDRQIAAELGITPKTASVHVANLKAKLGVETRVEAVLFARDRLGGGS